MAKAMTDDGTIDKAALEAAGGLPSDIKLATQKEIDKANTLLSERWSTIASS